MSRSILVVNNGPLQDQAFSDPSEVPAGVLAAFKADGGLLALSDGGDAGAEQDLATAQPFFFVIGSGDGGDIPLRRTNVIEPQNLVRVNYKAYTAPVKQVTKVTVTAGTEDNKGVASIRVQDMSEGYQPFPSVTADFKVVAGTTAAQVAQALANAMNNIKRAPVVASVEGSKVVLTAKSFGQSFATSIDGVLAGGTIEATTEPTMGSGTPDQVADDEFRNRAFMTGEYVGNDGILGTPERSAAYSGLAGGKNYNCYAVSVLNDIDRGLNTPYQYHEILIYIATDVAGNLDAFFGI